MHYEPVIGLEIHAQLQTDTKIFCGCRTAFGAPPNTQVCAVCLGLPGALPVLNRRAVDYGIRAALALGCRVAPVSLFARKHYFYPDLPKGYQISQYEQPLAVAGCLEHGSRENPSAVRIRRVHLEEDAGKSLHAGVPASDRFTHLDFNRSGVPLIEIVTEPDLQSPEAAAAFFGALRSLLVAIAVNDGNMEEGSLRCDANVSVRPAGATALGVKVEVKNINSFRFLQRAIRFECDRQIDALAGGREVVQETRLWDSARGVTVSMRSKEDAHDYRYFPEPDLRPLQVDAAWIEAVLASLPELPEARRRRFVSEYELASADAEALVQSRPLADYFEAAARAAGNPRAASHWVLGEVRRVLKAENSTPDALGVKPEALGELIRLVDAGKVSGTAAKRVFQRMQGTGESADAAVRAAGLAQMDDQAALAGQVRAVIAEQPDAVANYRGGKTATIGFLVGQVMRKTGGKANPRRVRELLAEQLED